jgi:hypothetical protein
MYADSPRISARLSSISVVGDRRTTRFHGQFPLFLRSASGKKSALRDGKKRGHLQREVGRDSIQVQVFQQTFFEIINPAVHHHRLVFSPRLLDDFSITRSANLSHDV